ncbi:TPA: hypothetical protein MEA48_004636 [Klebsiella pneumoniae]|nr:hypothetical protein [Klebsiella pneumoniae]
MKRYQICAVMVSALGHPALLPDAAKQILMHHVCTMPRAAEIIAALNDAGIDACREEDMCSSNSVGIWITVDAHTVLLQCQLEVLEVH